MPEAGSGSVQLLNVDPDLARELDTRRAREAAHRLYARAIDMPRGVLVSLRLSHRTLAGMIGARRPSVTTALGQLIARGELERRADGEWILLGAAPGGHVETADVQSV